MQLIASQLVLLTVLWFWPFVTYAGTIDSGEAPYERCALCHGLFGNTPRQKFPKLAGQKPDYMLTQIRAFKNGTRQNDNGQMQGVVTELSDEELKAAVIWFASQDPPEPTAEDNPQGRELFSGLGCIDCHQADQSAPVVPLLNSQHPQYLTKQMKDFRDLKRSSTIDMPEPGDHRVKLKALTDEQVESIASYLAAQSRQ